MKLVATFVVGIIHSSAALAQVPTESGTQPVLPNILSTVRDVSIDVRVDFTKIRDQTSDPTLLVGNVHAQYIGGWGLGGYVAVPIAYIAEGDFEEREVGNVELGGVYVLRKPDLDVYVRGAVAVDVDGDDNAGFAFDIGEAFLPFAQFVARPADAASTGLDTSWARAHAGMRLIRGSLQIGAQAGVDVALDRSEQDDEVFVLVASAAFAQRAFSVGAGTTLLRLVDNNSADDDTTLTVNVVGDVVIGPTSRVFGMLGLNLEDDFDGFSIGVGIRAGFGI